MSTSHTANLNIEADEIRHYLNEERGNHVKLHLVSGHTVAGEIYTLDNHIVHIKNQYGEITNYRLVLIRQIVFIEVEYLNEVIN